MTSARAPSLRRACSALVIAAVAACGARPPKGILGARWGDPVDRVAARLGFRCDANTDGPFEICRGGLIDALQSRASVSLVSQRGRLAGAQLDFRDCAYRDLQARIAKQFDVEYTPGETASPYTAWSTGEVVHFKECVLTVGNSVYGDYFVGELLRRGFMELERAMMPH